MAPTSLVLRLPRTAAGMPLLVATASALSVHCNAPLRTGSCGALRSTDTSDGPKLFRATARTRQRLERAEPLSAGKIGLKLASNWPAASLRRFQADLRPPHRVSSRSHPPTSTLCPTNSWRSPRYDGRLQQVGGEMMNGWKVGITEQVPGVFPARSFRPGLSL
jgi:hypothetical protein